MRDALLVLRKSTPTISLAAYTSLTSVSLRHTLIVTALTLAVIVVFVVFENNNDESQRDSDSFVNRASTACRDHSTTMATALFDLGRTRLDASFARSFQEYYLSRFRVLCHHITSPLVIFIDARFADDAVAFRRNSVCPTHVIPLDVSYFETVPYYDTVQRIRANESWLQQAEWLRSSPQAALPLYNPLVLSKTAFLARVAHENVFSTRFFFWVDAGLDCPDKIFSAACLRAVYHNDDGDDNVRGWFFRLPAAHEDKEIHGFSVDAMQRFSRLPHRNERVMRGGFFGGSASAVQWFHREFSQVLNDTLRQGYMGTEESIFTVVWERNVEQFRNDEVEFSRHFVCRKLRELHRECRNVS